MAEWGNELLAMTGQLIRTTEAQRNMENKVNAFGFIIMLLRIYCIEQLELLRWIMAWYLQDSLAMFGTAFSRQQLRAAHNPAKQRLKLHSILVTAPGLATAGLNYAGDFAYVPVNKEFV